jgi:hypothetical protein
MARERMLETAAALVAACREGREAEMMAALYDPGCVSVEAMPGEMAEAVGLEAIRGKHAWWAENFTLHDSSVEGPFPHGTDRFAVIFGMDTTENATGARSQMREVAVYTVNPEGRVVREEFFYGG